MIGSQWLLGASEQWSLDWWIIGGGYGSATPTFEASASNVDLNAADQATMKKAIETDFTGFNYIGFSNPKVETNNHGFKVTLPNVPVVGFRGFGLCLGYKF